MADIGVAVDVGEESEAKKNTAQLWNLCALLSVGKS